MEVCVKYWREREIIYCFFIIFFVYNGIYLVNNGKVDRIILIRFNSWYCYFDFFLYNSSNIGVSNRFYFF